MLLKDSRGVRGILFIVFLFFALNSSAQGMFGFDAGLGRSTTGRSYTTPAFTGYFLAKLTRTFYLGGAISYERYSFLNKYNAASASSLNILNIRQKSSYVFFTPRLDVGIGYRKYWHTFFSFGPGLLAEGYQVTNKYTSYYTTPPINTSHDTTSFFTTSDLPVLVSRYTIGVSRRIPTDRYWNIMISAEYSNIPTNLSTQGPALRTNYFAITVGIMHKYPMVLVEY